MSKLRLNKRRSMALAACQILGALLLVTATPTWAGEGHDHGDAAPAASGDGPKRQPDGSVFLPKPAQRQIAVRTMVVVDAELPRSIELQGKVVMDPNAGGKVQALVAGRLEAGPRGLPSMGQAVKNGDVLAYVVPSTGAIERSNQASALAELRAARGLAEKKVARLQALADTVPRKDIEAAQSELTSLTERVAALGGGLNNRDALVAPVSGVIASSNAVAGQVVDARELVFEVVDPTRLRIEALAYDAAVASDVAGATVAVGTDSVALTFIGAARTLREQALPMLFRAEGALLSKLAVGQPIKVFVQTATRVKGIRVPAQALLKNPANQTVVWVKTAPEQFAPRTVTVEVLDGASFAVTSGLQAGDRIATQGATLINQIR
ncbi:MAG: HlyD family efflux transporter periplasmic adaptor subunit [Gemmobacter sp.]|nr:HlyD family efflux transporter periplasmic adaptor subunit [Gemmobacter sp.]